MLKSKKLMNQSIDELQLQYQELCRDIFELKSEFAISRKLEKPHQLKEKKKDRARILTILRQKQLKNEKQDG